MRTDTPKTIYLKDYKPYPFTINSLDLKFEIFEGFTLVTATSEITRNNPNAKEIFLNGEELELLSVKINKLDITNYTADETALRVPCTQDEFTLEIKTKIYPEKNTRLEGLYNSGGTYCTQCEAEGFRRITYYPDRPDVLTTYTVRVEAEKQYPVLLSNGNCTEKGELEDNRHYAVWHDPFPKPCYLFALVAGDLVHIYDTFTTRSGREVDLYIYVREGDEKQCDHAMDSLKRSMTWDEEVYGLEYDLDIFNIVAVSDFNMGAMENKSLNIFNTALVLAHPETATDTDFMRVESVIAHEYFHNWSGNRVTCRDWFQLSLKEGLTVFRDQEFSADTHSRDVQRIDDVTHLRKFQFTEDASALAHPIRPDNYIEINNFYTMTIYEKGAEIIRMLRTLIGSENYRKGTDLYFERHDGQAVTCDDFVQAMQDASGHDLTQFKRWYSQAGTPELKFSGVYDTKRKTYTITLSQHTPDTPNQKNKQPMPIPVKIGLLDEQGKEITTEDTLILTEKEQNFTIENVTSNPIPSVLRNFSAPVKLQTDLTPEQLSFLMVHDTDGFNRWEAGQRYYLRTILSLIENPNHQYNNFLSTYEKLLEKATSCDCDPAFMARALTLPDIGRIGQEMDSVNPTQIWNARSTLQNAIAEQFQDILQTIYQTFHQHEFATDAKSMGKRALRNVALNLMTSRLTQEDNERVQEHYDAANNMTDRMTGLLLACNLENQTIINHFYETFKTYPLVVDKWFAAQAQTQQKQTIATVNDLKTHKEFNIKNPNRVRSLYAAFAMNNPLCFHDETGDGYALLKEAITTLNTINPQIAARLLTPFREWKRYTPDRQEKMKSALSDILAIENIAPDIYEIANKSLND